MMFISKETLLSKLDCIAQDAMISVAAVKRMIDDTPAVDAVQVVRCKDCKWRETACTIFTPDNWFCPNGERKES